MKSIKFNIAGERRIAKMVGAAARRVIQKEINGIEDVLKSDGKRNLDTNRLPDMFAKFNKKKIDTTGTETKASSNIYKTQEVNYEFQKDANVIVLPEDVLGEHNKKSLSICMQNNYGDDRLTVKHEKNKIICDCALLAPRAACVSSNLARSESLPSRNNFIKVSSAYLSTKAYGNTKNHEPISLA